MNSKFDRKFFWYVPIFVVAVRLFVLGFLQVFNDTSIAYVVARDNFHHYQYALAGLLIYGMFRKYLARYTTIILALIAAVIIEEHAIILWDLGIAGHYRYLSWQEYAVQLIIAVVLFAIYFFSRKSEFEYYKN